MKMYEELTEAEECLARALARILKDKAPRSPDGRIWTSRLNQTKRLASALLKVRRLRNELMLRDA